MTVGLLGSNTLRLPNELALLVIECLAHDSSALCALARTCRGLQYPAEAQIYKHIDLFSVTDLYAIIDAFACRYERARAVHTLKIQYQYEPEDLQDSQSTRKLFNACVAHMVNLREWHIESPFDNCRWLEEGGQEWVERDMVHFQHILEAACVNGPVEAEHVLAEQRLGRVVERTVGLALLQRLTIHSHGTKEDFWDLDGFNCLFRHPNLRHLHVSCITFPEEEIPSLAPYAQSTPLTTLIFDECELELESLRSILRTPAALKHLTLGENIFNIHGSKSSNPRLSRHASSTIKVLSVVAHSLESLTHLDPSWRSRLYFNLNKQSIRPAGDGMRSFHSLKYLECDTNSFLHRAVIMNPDLAPPNLDTLRLRRHWEVSPDFYEEPPVVDYYMALPSLSTLELMQSSFMLYDYSNADRICQGDRLRNRHAFAYKLYKARINFKLLIEMHSNPNLIPPYLHGELLPIIHCLYDASKVGFRRRTRKHPEAIPGILSPDSVETTSQAHMPSNGTTDENPETDQLADADFQRLVNECHRAINDIRLNFIRQRDSQRESTSGSSSDEMDASDMEEEVDDFEDAEDLMQDDEDDLEDYEDSDSEGDSQDEESGPARRNELVGARP